MDPESTSSDGLTVGEFAGAAIRLTGPAQSRDVLATRALIQAINQDQQRCND